MAQKPFEVVAECTLSGLPTSADIARISGALEQARRRAPGVVRAVVQPPARFKEATYVLEARFIAWAGEGEAAQQAVSSLLEGAGVSCRTLHLSGRALNETDVPRARASTAARESSPSRAASARAGTRNATRRASTKKPAARRNVPRKPAKVRTAARRRR
ncbi:MAG: hypothetical protein HY355_00010 [Armatimonadetes bacterium]|nr:hypothetical protein [Armatimonadota bacterium]